MRWICVPLLAVVVGCGPSQSDVDNAAQSAAQLEREKANNALAAQRNAMETDARNRDCASRETAMIAENNSAIEQDRRTVMTTLGAVYGSGIAFGARIETLASNEWRWVEMETRASDTSTEDRINYSVNPALLSPVVEVVDYSGLPAVRFHCNAANCIRAIGRRLVQNGDGSRLVDIDEGRSENNWALDTTNRAEVMRDALADLIRRTANPPRIGSCG